MSVSPPQPAPRRQRRIDDLCAATLRALTGDAELHFSGRRLHRGTQPLPAPAPHLRLDPARDGFDAFRAAADGTALRLLHSDAARHRRCCPVDAVERLIFELLEQLRVETLVPAAMPGMAANLRQRFAAWSRAFHRSGLTDSSLGILLYTVAQMCWSRLNALPVLGETEDFIEATRAGIAPLLGTALAGIRRHRRDQAAFAPHALAIARIVGAALRAAADEAQATDADEDATEDAARAAFSLLLEVDRDDADGIAAAVTGDSPAFDAAGAAYRVYTRRFDREVAAGGLLRPALLAEYRQRLDDCVAARGINLPRLARVLGAVLAEPRRDGWRSGEEEGRVDGRRLAQLVASPAERRLFRREQQTPVADAQVSFLVDCSGSMKSHVEPVATMLDILLRALEMAGARTELLGYTTAAWNGGRAQREWLARGRPRHPGRLNEVMHMVFKAADRDWRHARRDVAALLKADLYREGIDGEAVDWACSRLVTASARRRILIVISDGCPMDCATALANDDFYLHQHLKAVVTRQAREGGIEILGLGVGLDLSPFYRRSLTTDLLQGVDNQLFFDIAQLIGRQR